LWIDQAKTDGLEASTLMHTEPFIGRRKLADLAPSDVQTFRIILIRE